MKDERPWQSLAERSGAEPPSSPQSRFAAIPEMLLNRREFLKLTGSAVTLGALAACSGPPQEQIVPYVKAPPEYTPGRPLYYATALAHQGYARGVLVECHEARPTKIEGNLLHPACRGATDSATQAEIRSLWDANRSRTSLHDGQPATWDQFVSALSQQRLRHAQDRGAGLRILLEPSTSSSLLAQLASLQEAFPDARTIHYAPVDDRNAQAGAQLAFGEPVDVYARMENADVILALDCDFLGDHPDALRLSAEFARRRDPEVNGGTMNRLYVVECTPSITGAMADRRVALRSADIHAFAAALASELGLASPGAKSAATAELHQLAADLRRARSRSLILAGARQPPGVHALVHALNALLGSVGNTLDYLAPVRTPSEDLRSLVDDVASDRVQTLLILGANPVYTAPVDTAFAAQLSRVPFSAHLGLYQDETALACHWHVPQAHALETWGDLRAPDGTVSICQPMIAPIFDGRSERELLAILAGESNPSAYRLVRGYWEATWGGTTRADRERPPRSTDTEHIQPPSDAFTRRWQKSLQQGFVTDSASPPKTVTLREGIFTQPMESPPGIELNFLADPTIGDGRHAANPWLQELPKPLTKLTWGNALLIAPRTAARLGIVHERFAEVRVRGSALRAPVWVTPGHAEDAVTVHLGYGRRAGSPVAIGHGVNAYLLRHGEGLDFTSGATVVAMQETYAFANGQGHDRLEGRDLLRSATLAEYRDNPRFAQHAGEEQGSGLFSPFPYTGYKWAMSVNLNTCTGCSACVIACQAENNIPSVGKEEVRRGRKMHWLRIDRYYLGEPDAPRTHFQPVPCMQCENAPCEPVCPVEASIHDDEGINVQVYNRCIGTRFCSNNCPYKVRRFNFLEYTDDEPVSNHQRNPNVTVRMRGVMEKCNYCLQRIAEGRIAAELEGRSLRDGEVITACQAVCPTQAIVFGDLNDPTSHVNARKRLPRDYAMLAELHTRPRTTYLAKIINPPEPTGTDGSP